MDTTGDTVTQGVVYIPTGGERESTLMLQELTDRGKEVGEFGQEARQVCVDGRLRPCTVVKRNVDTRRIRNSDVSEKEVGRKF